MTLRQKAAAAYREQPKAYYHLCTDGWQNGKLFHTREQYALGMSTIALTTLKFNVRIYAFELMPNHIHVILSATGAQCLDCFYFIFRRVNKRLQADGYPPLPEDYWFKLIEVPHREAMKSQLAYLARNPYEKGRCTPMGHRWGTGYLLYNELTEHIRGQRVGDLPVRTVERMVESRMHLPPDWEIHPDLGILPFNFVDQQKLQSLFPVVKEFMTRMVKDYESYALLSRSLGEEIEWSIHEVREIVEKYLKNTFPGQSMDQLTREELCRMAAALNKRYQISPELLSNVIPAPVKVLSQAIRSKDYGYRHASGPERADFGPGR